MAFTTARVNAAIDGALEGATHVQLHTGDPGAGGTTLPASGVDAAALTLGTTSAGSNEATATWTIPGSGGPFTFGSLWAGDPAASGVHMGNFALTPAETFAGAGSLDLTLTTTGTSTDA